MTTHDSTRLTWDADGQLLMMQRFKGDAGGSPAEKQVLNTRHHLWNENGQLAMFISDDQAGYYGYDGNGERVYKLTGYVYDYDYNAGQDSTRVYFNDAVLYVNPYFIVTPKGYTKHYYNGSQRLASVVGDIQSLPNNMVKDGDNDSSKAYMHSFVSEDTLLNVQVQVEENLLLPVLSKTATGDAGGSLATNYVLKDNTYYYHGDHLGSASWITDGKGDIIEHRRYLPYGETWYEKRFGQSEYVERFKFTGKERDDESGYDYFGARYFDAMLLTSWMSVDPVVKYNESPYLYCGGNPIRMVDPDGRDWYENESGGIQWTKSEEAFKQSGTKGTYLGKAVLDFAGSEYETLGSKYQGMTGFDASKGSYGYIDGIGAITADVTMYGPNGPEDITKGMTGYTMTSDPQTFGAIESGIYTAMYQKDGKGGNLPSHWQLFKGKSVQIPEKGGLPNNSPQAGPNKGLPHKTGIYIHSTNQSGWAGITQWSKEGRPLNGVSTGCPLLAPKDNVRMNNKMSGLNSFGVRIRR